MHSRHAKKSTKPENPRNYNMCDSSDTASVRIERSETDEDIANPEVCVSGLLVANVRKFFKKWARGHIRDAIVVRIRRTSIISTSLGKKSMLTVVSRISND